MNSKQLPSEGSSTSSPRTYDGSRRQAEAVARRRRVVDAAHELFVTQGYGATSIAQIAAAADVSPQTIYGVFESKAGVLARLVDVLVAGDDAALGEGPHELVRDRHQDIDALADPDLRIRFRAIAKYTRISHSRSAEVLHLVDTVSGTDPVVAELAAGLLAAMREDIGVAVEEMPLDQLRPGLDHAQVTDLCCYLLGWRGYVSFVMEAGWTLEEYESRLGDSLTHLLLPDHR